MSSSALQQYMQAEYCTHNKSINILKDTKAIALFFKVQVKATHDSLHSAFSIERVATKLLPQYQPKSNCPILIVHEDYSDTHR